MTDGVDLTRATMEGVGSVVDEAFVDLQIAIVVFDLRERQSDELRDQQMPDVVVDNWNEHRR